MCVCVQTAQCVYSYKDRTAQVLVCVCLNGFVCIGYGFTAVCVWRLGVGQLDDHSVTPNDMVTARRRECPEIERAT